MKYFVSTSIPYINDSPHIGFLWELLLADFLARFQRCQDNEVFFLSGTDENGLKIYRTAEGKGLPIEKFADEVAGKFYALKDKFDLSFDYFIRTSSEQHRRGVYKFWNLAKQDIYTDYYEGLYCVGCEDYYKLNEVQNGICPLHQKPLEPLKEKNYFFKLTKYLPQVQELIVTNKLKIIPEKRKHETLNILKAGGFGDLSISRNASRSQNWGIKVPGDESQVIYVWFDALVNYVTGLGFGSDSGLKADLTRTYTERENLFEKFWEKADQIIHFIGKDIFKFHAIYWPAMLLSAGLRLPDAIVVHDFITVEGAKMSKSLGNVVSPDDLLASTDSAGLNADSTRPSADEARHNKKNYEVDEIRYYFLSQFSQFEDMNFSWPHLQSVYEGELKNEIGNFVSRVFGLLKKAPSEFELDENLLHREIDNTRHHYLIHVNKFEFNEALKAVFELVKIGNKFIEDNKIWQSDNVAYFKTLVLCLVEIAKSLEPAMPTVSKKILDNLRIKDRKFFNQKVPFEPLFA